MPSCNEALMAQQSFQRSLLQLFILYTGCFFICSSVFILHPYEFPDIDRQGQSFSYNSPSLTAYQKPLVILPFLQPFSFQSLAQSIICCSDSLMVIFFYFLYKASIVAVIGKEQHEAHLNWLTEGENKWVKFTGVLMIVYQIVSMGGLNQDVYQFAFSIILITLNNQYSYQNQILLNFLSPSLYFRLSFTFYFANSTIFLQQRYDLNEASLGPANYTTSSFIYLLPIFTTILYFIQFSNQIDNIIQINTLKQKYINTFTTLLFLIIISHLLALQIFIRPPPTNPPAGFSFSSIQFQCSCILLCYIQSANQNIDYFIFTEMSQGKQTRKKNLKTNEKKIQLDNIMEIKKSISLQETINQKDENISDPNIEVMGERWSKVIGKNGSVVLLYYQLQQEDQIQQRQQKPYVKVQYQIQEEASWSKRKQLLKSRSQTSIYSKIRRIESQIKIKIQKHWVTENAILNHSTLMFLSKHYPISQISKIKIFPLSKEQLFSQIKFVILQKILYFAVSNDKKFQGIPYHYLWFFKIIQQKIKLCFPKTNQVMKLRSEYEVEYEVKPKDQNLMEGEIFKKSQFLGLWKKRYIVIDKNGIHSIIAGKETFFIPKSQIKYLWTRFAIYQTNYLIIKVMHKSKTQFALPLSQFAPENSVNSWLKAFYQVMSI